MREADGIHSRMPSISLVSEMWSALHCGSGFFSQGPRNQDYPIGG
jgi:hypothetical protein